MGTIKLEKIVGSLFHKLLNLYINGMVIYKVLTDVNLYSK